MLKQYLEAAMRRARYKVLAGNEGIFGEIPGLAGLWENAPTQEECEAELASALEDWVLTGIQRGHALPEIDGLAIKLPEIA